MLANCLDPQTIEEATNSLNSLEALFKASFPGPLRDTVASDLCKLRSFIGQVQATQPKQSDLEANFAFGG